MSVTVRLSLGEVAIARMVGEQRLRDAVVGGVAQKYGAENRENHEQADVQGAAAEMAVASYLDRYWSGMGSTIGHGDVGLVEVRSTAYEYGSLLLHHDDHDDRPYVLAIVPLELPLDAAVEAHLRGWLFAGEGKQTHYWDAGKAKGGRLPFPAFAVPQDGLHSMDELRFWVDCYR